MKKDQFGPAEYEETSPMVNILLTNKYDIYCLLSTKRYILFAGQEDGT